jgi:hypothetical protein
VATHHPAHEDAAMTPTEMKTAQTTIAASAPAAGWHRRQRGLVAASLIAVPAVKRPTHRRWA